MSVEKGEKMLKMFLMYMMTSSDMSEPECGAICVRKDVMDRFNHIIQEMKLDANELMEHFFNLYNW